MTADDEGRVGGLPKMKSFFNFYNHFRANFCQFYY